MSGAFQSEITRLHVTLHGPVLDTAVKLVVRRELNDDPFIQASDRKHNQLTHRTFEMPNVFLTGTKANLRTIQTAMTYRDIRGHS